MEDKVLRILKNVLELDNVDTTCSQATCNQWDSMAQLNLVIELEAEFGVSFQPNEIVDMKSYNDILKMLELKGA